MTTVALPRRRIPWLLIIIAMISMPAIALSVHASKHAEADSIRCNNNIIQIWLNKSCERLNVIKDMEGSYANHVIQPRKCGIPLEITAYIFRNAMGESLSLKDVQAIMRSKGCTLVWTP